MTEHEKEQHLISLTGSGPRLDAIFTPLTPQTRQRSVGTHICTFFCALSCLFFITIVFLLTLSLLSRIQAEEGALRLAERAFSGGASFTVSERIPEDTTAFPFPDEQSGDDELPKETDAPTVPSPKPEPIDTPVNYPIQTANLSCGSDVFAFFNETTYEPDGEALLNMPLPFLDFNTWSSEYGAGVPYVLILHTHGTEAYAPEGSDTYQTTDSFRSRNIEENVVAVGQIMAETLEAAGIPTLHCTEMFDAESYQDSYSRAAAAIRSYLAEYPSIQIVLDVHRDSIIRADMTKIRPVTEVDGLETAQFMIVAGTNFKGADFPSWQDNLNFALKIQNTLISRSTSFARAINLRGAGFNEQYRSGSLLLEVGSCGNTLLEAKRAGVLASIAIANVVTGGGCILELSDILP